MGRTNGPYKPEFPKDSKVRIASRSSLEEFLGTWKYHHKLDPKQLDYAGQFSEVESVGFYHGGDELYKLKGIPGIWHEQCLEAVPPSTSGPISYRWRYDSRYYRAVINRYYRQVPWYLRLPIQYTMFWLVALVGAAVAGAVDVHTIIWWVLGGAIGIPALVAVTERGIRIKYRLRRSFGSEANYSMTEAGITINEVSLNGTYPWSVYSKAVRFQDGLLVTVAGGIRWLPDEGLMNGTPDAATSLVASHLPLRRLDLTRALGGHARSSPRDAVSSPES